MGWTRITIAACGALLASAMLQPSACASTAEGIDAFMHGEFKKALKELTPEARKNDPDALYTLGRMYAAGAGVAKDTAKATGYYRRAAELGNPRAQQSLGSALMMGDGIKQNMVAALKWFIISSRLGNSEAASYVSDVSKYMTIDDQAEARARATEWIEAYQKKQDQ